MERRREKTPGAPYAVVLCEAGNPSRGGRCNQAPGDATGEASEENDDRCRLLRIEAGLEGEDYDGVLRVPGLPP